MDPLSISVGILAIITATVQTSRALYATLQTLQDHPRAIRLLVEELRGLNDVLTSLEALAASDTEALQPLRLPLEQCCKACTSFQILLLECTRHSGGSKISFRDWAKLQYMGNDVSGFTSAIASYKSTICIALADANLRSSTVTLQVLNDYKTMIHDTTRDLEDRLEQINARLQSLAPVKAQRIAVDDSMVQSLQREQESTAKCLEICTDVLKNITGMRFQPISSEALSTTTTAWLSPEALTRADTITLSTLKECSEKLKDTIRTLQVHGDEAQTRLRGTFSSSSTAAVVETDFVPESDGLGSELESTKQCLAICNVASHTVSSGAVHVLEDVDIGVDGQQMLIASLGELFNVKRVTIGERGTQIVGTFTPNALEDLVKNQRRNQSP
ncbi:uncharacterized protein B0I36DRAFT_250387 [Microdochium trichocladiopsis]|uniref:Azaphilone pigments biosynthesis cluster protein L N-terminal domain-containing protein n=1 Tax=Microdochium trichocladiopsis TaxID=1682393 RepID=A0A9P8XZX5_9PEZI|nr:uncharacterized protein B0I36DRAFT_250387 [Microdochium trichocladiopsis]KAH7025125.1 hypothetical protein B0I36DRAFT_250387 [Microdochium trichocladiopsis]